MQTSWRLIKAITRYAKWTPTFTSVVVIVAKQHRMTRFVFAFFFSPKSYAVLLLKKGSSRLDDLSEIPAHIYRIEANPRLVAGQGDLQGSLGDIKLELTKKQLGWPCGLHYFGCILPLSRLRCCLTLVLGRSNLCFRHRRRSVNVSGPTGWHGSWSVGLWLNCWAVSQHAQGQNEPTTKSQASQLKDIQNFYCLNVLSGWMWLARIGMTQVNHYSLLSLDGAAH